MNRWQEKEQSQAIPAVNSTSWELSELRTLSILKPPSLREKWNTKACDTLTAMHVLKWLTIFCIPIVHYPDLLEIQRKCFVAMLSLLEVLQPVFCTITVIFVQLGKTFQFPLPKNFKGIFFRGVNLCSVIGEKESEMLYFHEDVKKRIFFILIPLKFLKQISLCDYYY